MSAAVYAQVEPSAYERSLAQLTVALLRENGVSDYDIIADYTREAPQADRAYETQFYREYQVRICAMRVKLEVRRILNH